MESQETKKRSQSSKQVAKKKSTKHSQSSSKQPNGSKQKRSPATKKKKTQARKLNNIEVRNSHANAKKKQSRFKITQPTKKTNEPHIYDEVKYKKKLRKQGKRNIKVISTIFATLFVISLLFIVRLETTNTKNGNNLTDYAKNNYTKTTSVDAKRGTIYDTNGEALAINLEVYDLRAITDAGYQCNIDEKYQSCAIEDAAEASVQIAKALDLSSDEQAYVKERLDYGIDNKKYEVSFGTLGKNITLSQKKALEKLNYPWLQFDAQELRFYPYGDFASYVIGYTTKDEETNEIEGQLGVEKALDGHLKGQDGVETSSFDNYGIELSDEQKSAIPKVDGTDVYLTLDSVIQTYLESSWEKYREEANVTDADYDGLFTIVMDAKTGDILAAQSYPTFDPNVRKIENYTNFFVNYCYEPGSTFKAATVAAADEAGVWDDNATVPTGSRSASTWGGAVIKDWNSGVGFGNITWNEGFYFSSNTVMTYIMDKIPKDFWTDFVTNKLLIGTPVATQFFETPSCVFNPKYDLEYATTSFGQGMTVNVLQMLRMYSALVGDGNMVTPHIVQTIKDSDTGETIYSDEDLKVTEDVISSETSEHIRSLLRGVVTYDNGTTRGTGPQYQGGDYDIGMKTGTAQMVGDNGQYEKDKFVYSAMTAAPIEDPQLLMYSVVIAPKGAKSSIAYDGFGQVTKEVYNNSLSYINSENRAVDLDPEVSTKKASNYVGKDVTDVGDSVIKVGSGEITDQYPKAGQVISTDQKVVVFGTKDLKFPDVTGYSYNETVAICNQLELACEFSNTGTKVKSVTNQGKNKYKIKME